MAEPEGGLTPVETLLLPGTKCPWCKLEVTSASTEDPSDEAKEGPKAGSVSVCALCLEYVEYFDDRGVLGLRRLRDEGFEALPEKNRSDLGSLRERLEPEAKRARLQKKACDAVRDLVAEAGEAGFEVYLAGVVNAGGATTKLLLQLLPEVLVVVPRGMAREGRVEETT